MYSSLFSPLSGRLKAAHRRFAGSQRASRQRQRHFRPRFAPQPETLEGRTLLTGGYVFSSFDAPGAGTGANGFQGTFVLGINASGTISGNYGDANSVSHGFLLSHGQYTTFDDPNAGTAPFQGTSALGLNERGQVVGYYVDSNNFDHGFLLSHGQYTTLDAPNGVEGTLAWSTNSSGQIVGLFLGASFVPHGFLLSHGQYTTLDDPSAGMGQGTEAFGINAPGDVVGGFTDADNVNHGFLLSHGQYTTMNDPNAGTGAFQGTVAEGINASGQIVGYYLDSGNVFHGFVLSHGQYTTLDEPSAGAGASQGTLAFGINSAGKIVGNYTDSNGSIHGFLATPVHGDVPFGATGNPASTIGTMSMSIALAAPSNTTPLGTLVLSAASTSRAKPSDGSGYRSSGQMAAVVTVPNPPQSAVDPGVTVNGARALGVRFIFGLKTY
jgi:probable HAF family extracellular repeat protein